MSDNKFKGFFNDPSHAMESFTPRPETLLNGLLAICGSNPLWYKDAKLRLMVASCLSKLSDAVRAEMESSGQSKIQIDPFMAAFIVSMNELSIVTLDEYGTDEERECFPRNLHDENEDEEDFD